MTVSTKGGTLWTSEDTDTLVALRNEGVAFSTIAPILGRTEAACEHRFSVAGPVPHYVSTETIAASVGARFGVRTDQFKSPERTRRIAHPRQVAIYLTRRITGRSYPQIGRWFGGRDHSTMIHAIRAVTARRLADAQLDADIRAIEAGL
jgi:chromosomal replication initiation ATPase DnaA